MKDSNRNFNSLHAQREACEAFIKSQAGEGWRLVKTAYQDGDLSGGTMERPALQRLVTDINEALAAIMFSDIGGYSTIMGRDERTALRALSEHRDLLRTLLPKYNGRMLGEIGDGTLTSFHSALDAVNCAREVQTALQDDSELRVRIGIHIGDVLFSADNVWGDGVNVASRIHALAAPGGICMSGSTSEPNPARA
jgi:class 3 adenylate cyclase